MKLRTLTTVLIASGSFLWSPPLRAADNPALIEPVKSVYARYLRAQTALAQDSLSGVGEAASAIAKAIRSDAMKMMAPEVARQAEALAGAKDLAAAREAFKTLSHSLIGYLAKHKVAPGPYYQAFCPMAKASWLQTGQTVRNPYFGKSMASCGQILARFTVPESTPGAAPGGPAEHGHSGHGMAHEH